MTSKKHLSFYLATILLVCLSSAQESQIVTQLKVGKVSPAVGVPVLIKEGSKTIVQAQKTPRAVKPIALPKVSPALALAKLAKPAGLPLAAQARSLTNAAGLSLASQATKLAKVGLPLALQAKKVATSAKTAVSQPLKLAKTANPVVRLPLLPKLFPAGLPVVPQRPVSTVATGAKLKAAPASLLLLKSNPLKRRVSPLKPRSTNSDDEKSNTSMDPMEHGDQDFKQVLGSSASFSKDTPAESSRKTTTRSSDASGNLEVFDYLDQAANPIDDLSMQSLNSNSWPNYSGKSADDFNNPYDYIPYQVWVNSERNLRTPNGIESVSDLMNEYRKSLNTGQYIQDPQFFNMQGSPELKSVMDKFQKSLSESSLLNNIDSPQKGNYQMPDNYQNYQNYPYSQNLEGYPSDNIWNSVSKLTDNLMTAVNDYDQAKYEKSLYNQNNHPINTFWNQASDMASKIANSVKFPDKTQNLVKFPDETQNRVKFPNKIKNLVIFPTETPNVVVFPDKKPSEPKLEYKVDPRYRPGYYPPYNYYRPHYSYAPGYGNEYYHGQSSPGQIWDAADNLAHSIIGHYGGYNKRSDPSVETSDSDNSEKIRNQRQLLPFMYLGAAQPVGVLSSALRLANGVGNNQPTEIVSSALQLASGVGNGGSNQPTDIVNSALQLATGVGNPGITQPTNIVNSALQFAGGVGNHGNNQQDVVNSALRLADGIASGKNEQIVSSGVSMGSQIAQLANQGRYGGLRFFKRSYPNGNVWDSATGLAESITKVAANPNMSKNDQIIGSAGSIWKAASGLAGNINNVAMDPSSFGNRQWVGSPNKDDNNEENSQQNVSPDAIWDSASGLASSITKAANGRRPLGQLLLGSSLQNPILAANGPIHTVYNSANNLAENIAKSFNMRILQNGQSLGSSNPYEGVLNQATSLKDRILNMAKNGGYAEKSPVLGTSFPTYAGGFFPRSNQGGGIWNSATQLASSIANTSWNPNTFQNGQLTPMKAIWDSATNLAGDISQTASKPPRFGSGFMLKKK